jgi:hypothetical protein
MKLFPILATLVAHNLTSIETLKMYDNLTDEIAQGEYKNMDLLHHLTSGGKAVFTQDT